MLISYLRHAQASTAYFCINSIPCIFIFVRVTQVFIFCDNKFCHMNLLEGPLAHISSSELSAGQEKVRKISRSSQHLVDFSLNLAHYCCLFIISINYVARVHFPLFCFALLSVVSLFPQIYCVWRILLTVNNGPHPSCHAPDNRRSECKQQRKCGNRP